MSGFHNFIEIGFKGLDRFHNTGEPVYHRGRTPAHTQLNPTR
jgi:hypothetical protein